MPNFGALLVVLGLCTLLSCGLAQDALLLRETFDGPEDVFESTWVKSSHEKYVNQPIKVKPPTKVIPGYENDKGVQLTQEMKHYGFATKFNQPLVANNGSEIVVQYELKLEEALACGGAYVKLLRADDDLNLAELSNETPYVIMFGPDKCGTNSKVHFILKHQNPVSKEWSEHHFTGEVRPKMDRSTHLYTLVIRSDNHFEIHIDTKPVAHGNLLHNLDPPINPPQEIDDPSDVKPADWVDDEFIVDASAVKPEDWDESQPRKIPSGAQDKPADWDESLPATVPDPSVTKPEFWDDEEDGYWEQPEIPNPACERLSGCGPWTPPMKDNPLYKGKWVPPKINNPDYKGEWKPRKVANPTYFTDPSPYASIAPMAALAVEVWTTSAGILFDNFAVGTDYVTVFEFGQATTAKKARAEREAIKKEEKEAAYQEQLELIESGTLPQKAQAYAEMAGDYLREHPMIIIDAGIAVVVGMIYMLLFGSWSKPATAEAKKKDSKAAEGKKAVKAEGEGEGEGKAQQGDSAAEENDAVGSKKDN